jgi:N-acetylmuramoyl-L-alanine amidase
MAAIITSDLADAFDIIDPKHAPHGLKAIGIALFAAFTAAALSSAAPISDIDLSQAATPKTRPVSASMASLTGLSITDRLLGRGPPPIYTPDEMLPFLPNVTVPEPVYPAMETASSMRDCNRPAEEVAVNRPAFTSVIGLDYGHAAVTGGAPDMGARSEVSVINRAARHLEPALRDANMPFVRTRDHVDGARFSWPHGYKENVAMRSNMLYSQGADMVISLHGDVRAANDSGLHIFVHADRPGGRADPASLDLARHVAMQFRRDLGVHVEIRTDNFSVLRNFKNACAENGTGSCPGMLIEIGNLRNARDMARMSSDAQMHDFAVSLRTAIQTYPGQLAFSMDPGQRSARLNLSCHFA